MTAALDRGLAALKAEFQDEIDRGLIVHLGTFNCRRKNNTSDGPWSEHSWPNAVDVMLKRKPGTSTPTDEAKVVGFAVARWMRDHPELWSEVFWQVAAHFDHVHGTATPRQNFDNKQVPPCAGGPDPEPEPEPIGDQLLPLSPSSAKEDIRQLQDLLNETYKYALTVDGVWGAATASAVKEKLLKFTKSQDPDALAGNSVNANMWNGLHKEWTLSFVPKPTTGTGVTLDQVRTEISKSKNVPG